MRRHEITFAASSLARQKVLLPVGVRKSLFSILTFDFVQTTNAHFLSTALNAYKHIVLGPSTAGRPPQATPPSNVEEIPRKHQDIPEVPKRLGRQDIDHELIIK